MIIRIIQIGKEVKLSILYIFTVIQHECIVITTS